jgi:diketogulonate reductase-like aldo/keto reductase
LGEGLLHTLSEKPVYPVGIGTFGIAGWDNPATAEALRCIGYKNIEPVKGNEHAEIGSLVEWLTRGANYFDTAELYGAGYTQTVVGRAIRAAGIPRADLFISGNVWKSSYGAVPAAVEGMLEGWGRTTSTSRACTRRTPRDGTFPIGRAPSANFLSWPPRESSEGTVSAISRLRI